MYCVDGVYVYVWYRFGLIVVVGVVVGWCDWLVEYGWECVDVF